jgi:hypothetical protein
MASLAVLATVALAGLDLWTGFANSRGHKWTGAMALILIGAAFIALQCWIRQARADRLKKAVLGAAFMLWGCEQFLPSSRVVSAVDTVVIAIFVIDMALIVLGARQAS